jgi:hypothetical protein
MWFVKHLLLVFSEWKLNRFLFNDFQILHFKHTFSLLRNICNNFSLIMMRILFFVKPQKTRQTTTTKTPTRWRLKIHDLLIQNDIFISISLCFWKNNIFHVSVFLISIFVCIALFQSTSISFAMWYEYVHVSLGRKNKKKVNKFSQLNQTPQPWPFTLSLQWTWDCFLL